MISCISKVLIPFRLTLNSLLLKPYPLLSLMLCKFWNCILLGEWLSFFYLFSRIFTLFPGFFAFPVTGYYKRGSTLNYRQD
jgi:hypothetical protein